MGAQFALGLCLLLPALNVRGKELTEWNWDRVAAGKIVFLKFFQPGCGFCTMMAPAWVGLMNDYVDSTAAGVYEVNCDGRGKTICNHFRITGYPTLKYGNASRGGAAGQNGFGDFPLDHSKDDGGRNYEALRRFAEKHLGPPCTPAGVEHCGEGERRLIEDFAKRSNEELSKDIAALTSQFFDKDKKDRKNKAKFDERHNDFQRELKELKSEKALFLKTSNKFNDNLAKSTAREKAKQEEKAKKMQVKVDALDQRRQDLLAERDALDAQREALDTEMRQSGLRLMKLIVSSRKAPEEEL